MKKKVQKNSQDLFKYGVFSSENRLTAQFRHFDSHLAIKKHWLLKLHFQETSKEVYLGELL